MPNDPSQINIGRWKPTFNGVAIGYTEKCGVKVDKEYSEIKTAQTLSQVLGMRLVGVKPQIMVVCKEVIKANIALAFPWYSGSGSIGMCPGALGADLYDYAHALLMHPAWLADNDASLDHTFTK